MECLKFSLKGEVVAGQALEVDLNSPQGLKRIMGEVDSSVCLVRLKDLELLRKNRDLFIDRKKKHPAKGLSSYLLAEAPLPSDKIQLIDGNFAANKVSVCLKPLLKNRGKGAHFIVGVASDIFEQLKEKVNQDGAGGCRKPERNFRNRREITCALIDEMEERFKGFKCSINLEERFLGASPDARLTRQMIKRAAVNDVPVLILGDTGTGKEVVARAIHDCWSDAKTTPPAGSYVPVNCGGIPEKMLESELFGHVKGAFTDAVCDKVGLWESAKNGTLFLDEIGDLLPEHQVKILRALEQGVIRRVGDTKETKVNARIIAASNKDLSAMMQAGLFREDLYYRLRGFYIRTPALREHKEDIPELAQFFWEKITGDKSRKLSPEVSRKLPSYNWPGNARELRQALTNLLTLFGTDNLRERHLKLAFHYDGRSWPGEEAKAADELLNKAECHRHLKRVDDIVHAAQQLVASTLEKGDVGSEALVTLRTTLEYRLNELEMVCHHPLLFNSEGAFNAVWQLKGKLAYFQGLLQGYVAGVREYWEKTLDGEFRLAMGVVGKELGKVGR